LRRLVSGASLADECIVQNNLVHRPGPDQERVRGVGSAKTTVTATFYDETKIVGPSEVELRQRRRR
jgi:hypothetical protein